MSESSWRRQTTGFAGGVYVLPDGLIGYGAGLGHMERETDDRCLILSIEVDEHGAKWAHVLRLSFAERVPVNAVTHWKSTIQ